MIRITSIALVVGGLLLGGCATAPQQFVSLDSEAMSSKGTRVGVVMTALPKIDTHFPGAGCLLCLAAASVANSKITDQTKTWGYEDIPRLKEEVALIIRRKGGTAVVIAEDLAIDKLPEYPTMGPNIARRNFTGLRKQYPIDKLVVIQIDTIGISRTYSAYFPTSDPKAVLQGRGFAVNLETNTYEWYQPVIVMKASDKEWDEPPKFPGLTNAYFQAIELGKDAFLKPFN